MKIFIEDKKEYLEYFKGYDKLVKTELNRYGDKEFKEMILNPKNDKELDEAYAYVNFIATTYDIRKASLCNGPLTIDVEDSANYELIKRIDDFSKIGSDKTPKEFVIDLYSDIDFYAKLYFEDEILKSNPPYLQDIFYEQVWEEVNDESLFEETEESEKKKDLVGIAEEEFIDKNALVRNNLVKFSASFCSYWRYYKNSMKKYTK